MLKLQISEFLEGRAEADVKENPTPPKVAIEPSAPALDQLEQEFDGNEELAEEVEDEFL